MPSVKVINGDLYIIFQENKDDALVSYRLDNGAEIDFYNDELVQFVLPNFEAQLNQGILSDVPIEYVDTEIVDNRITFIIKILNDIKNISINVSSIIHKIYI